MQQVTPEISATSERRLDRARVPATQRADYHKWVRFYLDFCHKYGHPPASHYKSGFAEFRWRAAAGTDGKRPCDRWPGWLTRVLLIITKSRKSRDPQVLKL